MTDVDQGDDTPHPFDSPVIRWCPPRPLCTCDHERWEHNHDRAKSPCTHCACKAWTAGPVGVQVGSVERRVAL